MDEKKKAMLERAGFGKTLIDQLAEADGQREDAGITDETMERTLEHLSSRVDSRPEPTPERSWLFDKYQRAVEFLRDYL